MKARSIFICSLCASLALACALGNAQSTASRNHGSFYQQTNLVSDGSVSAANADANLVNAWGIAFNPFGVVWVANNGTGTSTLYDGNGMPQSLVVQIPTPSTDSGGNPTGIVFNGSSAFTISKGGASGASRFIFVTEDGVIAGWAPAVDSTHAVLAHDSSPTGAIYKGLALSAGGSGQLLYATDFHNGHVDVFDNTFTPVVMSGPAFTDARLPNGFAPFGIQSINGDIYVTYAQQDAERKDELHGPGLGYVDVYDPSGKLLRRVASRGRLNAPWGIALAPAGFGNFGNALLIGNFGDGRINGYDPFLRFPLGPLTDQNRRPIQIDGLWGIAFGNGFANQPVNTLFFAAGPADEQHGLYGRIDTMGNADQADDD